MGTKLPPSEIVKQSIDFMNQASLSSSGTTTTSKEKKKTKDTVVTTSSIVSTIDTASLLRECRSFLSIVQDRLQDADRTNLRIYHNVIPNSIPTIPAQQLAKINPILPNDMIVPQIPLFIDL
jgi:hypothetical protein